MHYVKAVIEDMQRIHLHHDDDDNEDYCGDDIADDDDSNAVVVDNDDCIYDVDNGRYCSPLHHFTSQMGHDSTGSFSIQSSPKMTSR